MNLNERLPTYTKKIIWQISDGKQGHENQCSGLIGAISKLLPVKLIIIDVTTNKASWIQALTGTFSFSDHIKKPDLIIGAGSQTHATILAAGRNTGAPTIVMMAPPKGFARLFDLCIVPEHDGRSGANIITTKGVINLVETSTAKDPKKGLLLIGGPSKHHGWDSDKMVEQVRTIVEKNPVIDWITTTSRRSPEGTVDKLNAIGANKLTIVPVEATNSAWLPTKLSKARYVWVTEDSVSMIYEALSSGAKVGVLPVPRSNERSRVIQGVKLLIQQRQVMPYRNDDCDLSAFEAPKPLNEAARIAAIVVQKFLTTSRA